MLEESDANLTSSKIYLKKGNISENQNRCYNFKITGTEFKNSVSGLNIRLDVAEERISELRNGSVKIYIYKGKSIEYIEGACCYTTLLKTVNGDPHGGEKTERGIRNASRG